MGFIEFDKIRYWDYRWNQPCKITVCKSKLMSDHNQRKDKHLRRIGDIINAQK